jgi:two-component system, NtrC family, sensor histidine kinase HydH
MATTPSPQRPLLTGWSVVAVASVCVSLAAVMIGAVRFLRRDRAATARRFESERLQLLDGAIKEIAGDLADVAVHLRFASRLVQTAESPLDHQRELRALLAVAKQYRLAHVYESSGRRVLAVADPLADPSFDPEVYSSAMARVAARALSRAPGEIEQSAPLGAPQADWLRAFGTAFAAADGSPAGALVLLVDTSPFIGPLRLLATDPSTWLLVLGPYGGPVKTGSQLLEQAAAKPSPGTALAGIVSEMRAGHRGARRVDGWEAARLGLGDAEAIAAYGAIPVEGSGHWAAAIFMTTATLRAHERAIVWRLSLASAAVALCLMGFGAYVVVASRRAAVLRERLQHAGRLAHLHEKSEKILDNVPVGVMALSEDGVITAVNRALRERIPGSALGGRIEAALPDAPTVLVDHLAKLVDDARASGRVQSLLGESLALFGKEGQYNVHAVPLEPRFPEARSLLVIEDLSEVRSLASQLLRAEKLATVGVLAAGIAHEIGTPLGVVRGRAEYLLQKLGDAHPHASGARVIVDQIDHVSRTIRRLLDFSRVQKAAVRPVVLGPVARAVVELLQFEIGRRGLAVDLRVPDRLPPLAADPDQLQQTLVNLVLNACDACGRGGRIAVTAGVDEGAGPPAWEQVRLEVVDDGCGIPEAHRNEVFDPFFTTKKRGLGTGLGLTIVAQIVRNHAGRIEIDSAPGCGTRVSILWPIARAAQPRYEASA